MDLCFHDLQDSPNFSICLPNSNVIANALTCCAWGGAKNSPSWCKIYLCIFPETRSCFLNFRNSGFSLPCRKFYFYFFKLFHKDLWYARAILSYFLGVADFFHVPGRDVDRFSIGHVFPVQFFERKGNQYFLLVDLTHTQFWFVVVLKFSPIRAQVMGIHVLY